MQIVNVKLCRTDSFDSVFGFRIVCSVFGGVYFFLFFMGNSEVRLFWNVRVKIESEVPALGFHFF